MLSGDNGLLKKAGDAKSETEIASIKEQIQLQVLGSFREYADLELDKLKTNLQSIGATVIGLEFPLTVTLDNQTFTVDSKGNVTKPTPPTPPSEDYLALREGDIVYYKDANNNDIECTVLYDSQNANYSTYGVQIIPRNPVTTKELGNGKGAQKTDIDNFNIAKGVYNDAINVLNTAAEEYVTSNPNLAAIAKSSRCVGSLPGSPNTRNTAKYTHIEGTNNYFAIYDEQFEAGEDDVAYTTNNTTNYTVDWAQLGTLGIKNITDTTNGNNYWLASRYVYRNSESTLTCFPVCMAYKSGKIIDSSFLCGVNSSGVTYSYSKTQALRPVITLKSNIKIAERDGKKYLTVE